MSKIILDLCGGTGAWSKPYKDIGYRVINITLPEFNILTWRKIPEITQEYASKDIYGILAAPPCTEFSKANWRVNRLNRNFKEGMKIVKACLNVIWYIQEQGAPLKFWALENPVGYLYNFLGKPAFYFQPWQFGETDFRATKKTGIWGYFNQPVKTIKNRTVPYIRNPKKVKQGNLAWGPRSSKDRAITSPGFAKAFFKANQ